MSILYGVGAALTLDEFALWLNLRDVIGRARDAPASTPSFCSDPSWPPALGALHCFDHATRKNLADTF